MNGVFEPCLTLILPTYELHFTFAASLLESIDRHVTDRDQIQIIVVVERDNLAFVSTMVNCFKRLRLIAYTTEQVMADLSIKGTAADLLRHSGKFNFQSIKKIGGVLQAKTDWVLVMDSESTFLRDFSARELLDDYRRQKYVFFTRISDRGEGWARSLSASVTANASALIGVTPDAWYLEYYHWFYETSIWVEIVKLIKSNGGFDYWIEHGSRYEIFENVLYYCYVKNKVHLGYNFFDSLDVIKSYLPAPIAARAKSALLGDLQVVGLLEHVTSILSVDELPLLEPLFDAYALPFIRIEPYTIDPRVIDTVASFNSVRALVSSHRARVLTKRIAVCVAGEFRSLHSNLRSVRDFTTGVACDFFIHSWNTPAVPAIKDTLEPTRILVESAPDFSSLAEQIVKREPGLKPGRDAGSLAMFYGIAASIGSLIDHGDQYDLVVRMRPDAIFQDSLRDLLVLVADNESFDENTVYVPDRFHSQGVNDQFAIGAMSAMRRYGEVMDFVVRHIDVEYFNPEYLIARHLLSNGIVLKTLPMRYTLLRSEPTDLVRSLQQQTQQNSTWWSAPLSGPDHIRAATAFFTAKVSAMSFMAERAQFGDVKLLISTEYLTPEATARWRCPFLKIEVKRDYKNPAVTLVVDPSTHTSVSSLYIDVQPHGLELSSAKPEGTVFLQGGYGAHDVRLVRFADDLANPAAEIVVSTHSIDRIDEAIYSEAISLRPIDGASVTADPESNVIFDDAAGVADCGTSLMQRFLLPEPARKAGLWRSTRAMLELRRGRECRRRGDLVAARTHYARVLALNPGRRREWVQFGHVLKDSGSLKQAISAYAMALTLCPEDPDAQLHHAAAKEMVAGH